MKDFEQKAAARQFIADWQGRGDEKQDTQRFWLELLQKVYGVVEATKYITFELPVKIDHTSFIDGFIEETRVLIEQKSFDIDLKKGYRQSDGAVLNPYQQGRRYAGYLPHNLNPRWIIACNFQTFEIHDMNRPNDEPEIVALADLEKEYPRLQFLVDAEDENTKKETEISKKAGDIVGLLYKAFLKQYHDLDNPETLKSLNALCVRLVFCFYAEDANVFGHPRMFHNYLNGFSAKDARRALIDLFKVLDTPVKKRDEYIEDELKAFPYVNGGLFSDENIIIPQLNDEIMDLILRQASENFDWSTISPTIFGALFESTLNPDTRRKGGMHYTSIANINKVIEPLFLNELRAELEEILRVQVERTRRSKLEAFQARLASLRFLDPACGSGNFLTQSYLSLRRLENVVISELNRGQLTLDVGDPIKVSIGQFYGIEINDFAVTVAKTALWIAESQMLKETMQIVHRDLNYLPLKSYANIVEGNALRLDWAKIVPKDKISYIMGNPPFVGQQLRIAKQSDDMAYIFGQGTPETKLDYVLCWYKKALDFMKECGPSKVKAAFVSTNSICQGESVPTFWKRVVDEGLDIGFAYRSFKWSSESNDSAAVICIIVGFSYGKYKGEKCLFESGHAQQASHINAYLQAAPDIWITSRRNVPADGMPKMIKGSEPSDGGNLFLNAEEKDYFEKKYPVLQKYIKPFVGGDEYLNQDSSGYTRYCFWMVGGNPADYAKIPELKARMVAIADKRAGSSAERIRKRAEYPYLFCQIRQPKRDYLLFPRHSSSERRYIPIGYMSSEIIAGDACYIIPDAPIYLFGILTSNVHMAWMRLVCGRLGNGYRYSPAVYNNFPFPSPTEVQRLKIEQTAQSILDARNLYPDASLSALYNESFMPPELRKAHQDNDRAVMQAYGFSVKAMTESQCVAELMKMYQKCTNT